MAECLLHCKDGVLFIVQHLASEYFRRPTVCFLLQREAKYI